MINVLAESNMITFVLLKTTNVFYISSDTFKEWVRKVNDKHEITNKASI